MCFPVGHLGTDLMKATVILPCYNGEDTLAQQMDALARQNWQDDWEFIMADNGSTDRSVEIVLSYSDRIPNIRILNVYSGVGPRNPVAVSYTKAFEAAKSDIFITCEADDEAGEGWLEAMVEAMQDAHYVGSAIDDHKLNPDDMIRPNEGMQSPSQGFPNFIGPMKLPFSVGCTVGISRHLWKTIGDPDVDLGNTWDVDYCWRAQLAGFELKFVPDVVMHYRQRTSFEGRYKQGKQYGLSAAKLTAKYGVKSRARYLAFNLYQLSKGAALLAWSTLPGTRPARHRVWRFANALGQLQGFKYVREGRSKTMPIPDHLKPLTAQ